MAARKMYRKKNVAKKVKKVRRSNKKAANNLDTTRKSIKLSSALSPAQGVIVSNYAYCFISPSPSATYSPNVSCALFNSPEFKLHSQMYDQFRVHSVSLKVIPRYNVTDTTNVTLLTDNAELTMGRGVFYTVEDRDGIAPSSLPTLKKYSSVKVHKITKVMSRTYACKYEGNQTWFDCQNPDSMIDIQRSLGLTGGITLYGESFPEANGTVFNNVWADIEVHYNLTFRGKAIISISVGQNGQVTLSQVPVQPVEAVQVFTTNDEIANFGSVDLSGNTIGTFTIP